MLYIVSRCSRQKNTINRVFTLKDYLRVGKIYEPSWVHARLSEIKIDEYFILRSNVFFTYQSLKFFFILALVLKNCLWCIRATVVPFIFINALQHLVCHSISESANVFSIICQFISTLQSLSVFNYIFWPCCSYRTLSSVVFLTRCRNKILSLIEFNWLIIGNSIIDIFWLLL